MADALDMSGQVVIVTGGGKGIGRGISERFLAAGAEVVICGRNEPERIPEVGGRRAVFVAADVRDADQGDRVVQAAVDRFGRLDVLVNNAGGVNKARTVTADGIETTFAVNHLGYFLLTNLLLDLVVKSAPARVVTVASVGHRRGTLDFEDLGFERGGYSIMRAYSRSKLANILFANELARRRAGSGVTSNSLHPGSVDTNIWSGAPLWAKPIIQVLLRPFFISAEKGGERIVQLAASPELEGVTGKYFEDGKVVDPAPLARDASLATRLWDVSARMVGLAASP